MYSTKVRTKFLKHYHYIMNKYTYIATNLSRFAIMYEDIIVSDIIINIII